MPPTLTRKPGPSPFKDATAADRIRELREDRGLTWWGLQGAVRRLADEQNWLKPGGLGAVDADTIKAIEEDDHVPSLRVQLVLSLFFGVDRRSIWKPQNRRAVTRDRVPA